MQGKFCLSLIHAVGNFMEEDDFLNNCFHFHHFISKFKVSLTLQKIITLAQFGVGKF